MDLTRWNQIKEIFAVAVELPVEERERYLRQACRDVPGLQSEVASLLNSSDAENAMHSQLGAQTTVVNLESPPKPVRSEKRNPNDHGVGSQIDRYKLLQLIGEGGFGMVYLAEQEEPVVRKVALKLIKLGMDTKQVVARFEAERQALAMMEHPNIARVFDGGTTDFGRPYFVMELVKGVPITEYCDANKLTPSERMELFIQVCNAIQHAHQKGIIHRDLKPNNVLVTLHDGKPVPKVIDFGIAKALNQRLTEKTLFTEFKQMIGTPAYMSPEQAEMSGLDIDTRSDIYSLGVLLYELLTGSTPFDAQKLRRAAFAEIHRIIREEEPPRPSTRLGTMGATLSAVAADRRSDPRKLIRFVQGELDWIIMKAMEKDRSLRYETVSVLGLDVQRYLRDEPVSAGPPSALYRLKKLARRHKKAVVVATTFSLILAASTTISSLEAVRATRAQRLAESNARRADYEANNAKAEAAKQGAITRFFKDILASANPVKLTAELRARGREVTLKQALDEAARKVELGSLKSQPFIEASVRYTIGNTYYDLGDYEAAEKHLRKCVEILRAIHPHGSHELSMAQAHLADALAAQRKVSDAESYYRHALTDARNLYGDENADVASLTNCLARFLEGQGQLVEAEDLYRQYLYVRKQMLKQDDPETAIDLIQLATVLDHEGKETEAKTLIGQARGMAPVLVREPSLGVGTFLSRLAGILYRQGDLQGAEVYRRQALTMYGQVLGEAHPYIATELNNLACVLQSEAKMDEAESACRRGLSMRRSLYGEDHPSVGQSMSQLAALLEAQGKVDEARVLHRQLHGISAHGRAPSTQAGTVKISVMTTQPSARAF